jgi:hypothetical protein
VELTMVWNDQLAGVNRQMTYYFGNDVHQEQVTETKAHPTNILEEEDQPRACPDDLTELLCASDWDIFRWVDPLITSGFSEEKMEKVRLLLRTREDDAFNLFKRVGGVATRTWRTSLMVSFGSGLIPSDFKKRRYRLRIKEGHTSSTRVAENEKRGR